MGLGVTETGTGCARSADLTGIIKVKESEGMAKICRCASTWKAVCVNGTKLE